MAQYGISVREILKRSVIVEAENIEGSNTEGRSCCKS